MLFTQIGLSDENKKHGKRLFQKTTRALENISDREILQTSGNVDFVVPLYDALVHLRRKQITDAHKQTMSRETKHMFTLFDSLPSFTASFHYKQLKEEMDAVPKLVQQYGADANTTILWLAKGLYKLLLALLEHIKAAAIQAAHDTGEFANKQNSSSVTTELLFYLFTFFHEPNIVSINDRALSYLKRNGVELADYLSIVVEKDNSPDGAPPSTSWLIHALKHNHFIVIETFAGIKARMMQYMCEHLNGLAYVFDEQFQRLGDKDVLDELRATAMEMGEVHRSEPIKKALAALDDYKLGTGVVGTVDPWLTASVMRQAFCEDPDVGKYAGDAICMQRFGKSADTLASDISILIGTLKSEMWLAIAKTYGKPESTEKDINASIDAYLDISARSKGWRSWFGGGGGDEEDDDDSETEDEPVDPNDKGKEEETPAQANSRIRRERRRESVKAHFDESKTDPDMQNLYTVSDVKSAIAKLDARIAAAKVESAPRIAEESSKLARAQRVTDQLIIDVNSAAVSARASSSQQLVVSGGNRTADMRNAITHITGHARDMEIVVADRVEDVQDELRKLQQWKAMLENKVRERTARLNNTGRNAGIFILLVGGVLILLCLIWRLNKECMNVNTTTLIELEAAAAKTYTQSMLTMLKTKWQDSMPWWTGHMVREAPLPSVMARIAAQSITNMVNFRITFTSWTLDGYNMGVAYFYSFVEPYTVAAQGLLDETNAFIAVQTARGVPLTDPVMQGHIYMVANIKAALAAVQRVMDPIATASMGTNVQAFMEQRSIDMSMAVGLLREVISNANAKMMSGKIPDVLGRTQSTMAALAGIGSAILTKAWSVMPGKAPAAADLTLAGLQNVAFTPHNEMWGKALKAAGDAQISLTIIPVVMVSMTAFSVGNIYAAIMLSHGNAALIVTEHGLGLTLALKKLWDVMASDVMTSAALMNELRWANITQFVGFALWFLPMFGFAGSIAGGISKLGTWYANRQARVEAETQRARLEGIPVPKADEKPQIAAPAAVLAIEPSTPQVATMFRRAAEEHVHQHAAHPPTAMPVPASTPPAGVVVVAPRRRRPRQQDETPAKPRTTDTVDCSICDQPALVQCKHCDDRKYCGRDCARLDALHLKKK